MSKTTMTNAIKKAVKEYLEYNTTIPEQFNIAYSIKRGWKAEFHTDQSCWNEGFITWNSNQKEVLEIFFSQDEDLVGLHSWNEEWNDQ